MGGSNEISINLEGAKRSSTQAWGPPACFSGFPSTSGQEAGGRGAVLRCLDPSSVPTLLPELAISPEAAPMVAETAALSVLPLLLLMMPTQPPLPPGDSALEPEQQAGGSNRMREDGREKEALARASNKKEQGCFSHFFSLSLAPWYFFHI